MCVNPEGIVFNERVNDLCMLNANEYGWGIYTTNLGTCVGHSVRLLVQLVWTVVVGLYPLGSVGVTPCLDKIP